MSRKKGHNQPARVTGRRQRLAEASGCAAAPETSPATADEPGMPTPGAAHGHTAAAASGRSSNHLVTGLDCNVLVLNKLYMAVRVTNARRAFSMLIREMAEVVHIEDGQWASYDFSTWAELSELRREYDREHHDWVRTVSFEIAVPRVVRLLGYDRLPQQHVKLNRRNLFARDRNRCQYCGHVFPTQELSIDHVVPRTQGGGESWTNLVCSCVKCNARKGGRTPTQANMQLIKKPVRPKRHPLISLKLGQERYESWKAFLDEAYWSVELR